MEKNDKFKIQLLNTIFSLQRSCVEYFPTIIRKLKNV